MSIPLTFQIFSPKFSPHLSSPKLSPKSSHLSYARSFSRLSDTSLASDLAAKIASMVQTEEAVKKSREILFGEICEYVGCNEDEMKQKWRKIDDEEEKLSLVKGFVDVWGSNFHPLSAKSVVEMVEEYLREENDSGSVKSSSSSSGFLFPGLKKFMGFS